MFRPSEASAELALQTSRTLPLEMHARAAQKNGSGLLETCSSPQTSPGQGRFTLADVQDVLGERLVGLVAMLARQHACLAPRSRLPVTVRDTFAPEVERQLVEQLNLVPQHPHYADTLRALAADLRAWVVRQPAEAEQLDLRMDPLGELVLTCYLLQPVLPPLPD